MCETFKKKLKGIIVAVVTPMKKQYPHEIDYEAFSGLLYYHTQAGTTGIVVSGTTGESPTMTREEFSELLTFTINFLKERKSKIFVIAGTGTSSTEDTIEKTLLAKSLGAEGALVVTPQYNKPTQEGLYLHYKKISEATQGFSIIIYNVPSRTGCDILSDTVALLSLLPNIVGIKEACGKMERFKELQTSCVKTFVILSGEDGIFFDAVLNGLYVSGVISVTANVAAFEMVQAYNCSDLPLLKKYNDILKPLHSVLFVESNPIPVKALLSKLQKIDEGIRLPLTWLPDSKLDTVYQTYLNMNKEWKTVSAI